MMKKVVRVKNLSKLVLPDAGYYRTHECVPNRDTRVQHGTIGTKAENYYF